MVNFKRNKTNEDNKLYNINIDCNSKKGKILIEVVEKGSTIKK